MGGEDEDQEEGSESKEAGPRTRFIEKSAADEKRAEERADKSDDRLYKEMQRQRDDLNDLLDDEKSRSAWLIRFIIFLVVFLLVMFGVAVGVVQTGSINLFGFGTVEVGASSVVPVEKQVPIERLSKPKNLGHADEIHEAYERNRKKRESSEADRESDP